MLFPFGGNRRLPLIFLTAISLVAFVVNWEATHGLNYLKVLRDSRELARYSPLDIKTSATNGCQRELPQQNENGLLIFFLHIPKTGGSTLRHLLRDAVDHYYSPFGRQEYKKQSSALEEALDNWDGKVHCFELHSATSPAFVTVLDQLLTWKELCEEKSIPFFAFTVMREPVSFSFSFFQFYHTQHGKFKYFETANESDFLEHSLGNPQCLFLSRSEQSFLPPARSKALTLSESECDGAYDALIRTMDWVGTTSNLSNVTIPLLSAIMHSQLNQTTTENKSPIKNFDRSRLSEHGLHLLHKWNRFDESLYKRLKEHYGGPNGYHKCIEYDVISRMN